MSRTRERSTTFRAYRACGDTWRRLSPARRASQAVLWSLLVVFVVGALACLVAYTRMQDPSLAEEVILDAIAVAVVTWMVVHDPPMPSDPSHPALAPTIVHSVAALLTLAVVPWVLFAGLLGADLSTRPDFYGQVAQIIPVLLLAVLFERRFFAVEPGRSGRERGFLRAGFVVLVVGPGLAEILALLAIASHVQWIEVVTTVLAASSIPALLVLLAGPVLLALYAPTVEEEAVAEPVG